jgi:hypothetical protein
MKSMIGKPVQELVLEYGPPDQVVDMPDGSRAYQFKQGGGQVFMPGTAQTNFTSYGATATATTTATPGMAFNTDGCRLTFIARQEPGGWFVRDIRVPKQLVC